MLCHPICNWLYVDKVGHSHAVIHTDERGDYIRMRWLWCWCSVDAHIWMSHVANMNESRGTYECVMSHIWMRWLWCWCDANACGWLSHGTYMNESWHTCECVMPRMRVDDWGRVLSVHDCDMAHSYATWLIHPHSHRDELSIQSCILNPHSHAYSIRIDTIE